MAAEQDPDLGVGVRLPGKGVEIRELTLRWVTSMKRSLVGKLGHPVNSMQTLRDRTEHLQN